VTTDENIIRISKFFKKNHQSSITRAAQALEINRESLRLMVRYLIGLYPYKIQTNQVLTGTHTEAQNFLCGVNDWYNEAKPGHKQDMV